MKERRNIYQENRDTVLLLLVPIAIIAKMIEHLLLPAKYFNDSTRMLNMMAGNDSVQAWGGSYEVTTELFSNINVFNFTTLLQWSMLIGIIFNILLIIAFIKMKYIDMVQSIFALMCVGLCNIYVFNLGKDIIQFTFFVMCFVIICFNKFPNWLKVVGCVAIFYWESTFFRSYYIIMAAFTIGIYIILKVIRHNRIRLNFKKITLVIAILFLLMYAFLNIARVAMPKEYNEILHCKDDSTQLGAASVIKDKIEFGEDVNLYMLNYIINSVRMLFPVELVSGGVFYLPFLVFQVLLLYYMYKNIKEVHQISDNNVIALSVFIAFFMGSVLFEPDFGSFARHEAAAFPVIILFALDNVAILKTSDIEDSENEKVVVYE